jgi:hypothetical protein
VTSPGNMADAPMSSRCAWQGTSRPQTTDVQKGPDVSSTFLRIFPSHCIPEATKGVDLHFPFCTTFLWNKFVVDETLGIARSADSR